MEVTRIKSRVFVVKIDDKLHWTDAPDATQARGKIELSTGLRVPPRTKFWTTDDENIPPDVREILEGKKV